MYIGVGSKRVRSLFDLARKNTPCLIYIDEIDALGSNRNSIKSGSSAEHNITLNELLSQMDGFNKNEQILVIASTNRYNDLDPALTRSGRFDIKINFDPPNLNERIDIFKLYLKKIKTKRININGFSNNLAIKTSGVSCADIFNICNQAAIISANRNICNCKATNIYIHRIKLYNWDIHFH